MAKKKEKKYPWTFPEKKKKTPLKKVYKISSETREYLIEEIFDISYHTNKNVYKYLCYLSDEKHSETGEHRWELRDEDELSYNYIKHYEEIIIEPDMSKYEIRELIQETLDSMND